MGVMRVLKKGLGAAASRVRMSDLVPNLSAWQRRHTETSITGTISPPGISLRRYKHACHILSGTHSTQQQGSAAFLATP